MGCEVERVGSIQWVYIDPVVGLRAFSLRLVPVSL